MNVSLASPSSVLKNNSTITNVSSSSSDSKKKKQKVEDSSDQVINIWIQILLINQDLKK